MPSEPGNKIEELLKAYAKKRRDEAGAPFDLHPATRKLLQSEVARQWPKDKVKSTPLFQILITFWPRLAFVGAIAVAIGTVVWLTSSKPAATNRMALNAARPATDLFMDQDQKAKDSPAPSEPQSKKAEADVILARPEGMVKQLSEKEGETLKREDRLAIVTAPVPALTPPPPVVAGDGRQGTVDETRNLALNKAPAAPAATRSLSDQISATATQPGNGRGAFGGGLSGSQSTTDSGLAAAKPALRDQSELSVSQAKEAKQLESFGFSPPARSERGYALALGLDTNAPVASAASLRARYGATTANGAVDKLSEVDRKLTLGAGGPQGGSAGDLVASRNVALADSPPVNQPQSAGRALAPALGAELNQLSEQAGVGNEMMGKRLHFSQNPEPIKAAKVQAQAAPVPLASFDLEQNGDRVRIYDADGSVYDGLITASTDSTVRLRAPVPEPVKGDREARDLEDAQKLKKQTELLGEAESTPQTNFRASGTNRSLNQLVVIQGSLVGKPSMQTAPALPALRANENDAYERLAPAPAAAPAEKPASLARSKTTAQSSSTFRSTISQGPASASPITRVLGRAKVGTNNDFEINAVPAPR